MLEHKVDWAGALVTLSQVRRRKVEWLKIGGGELLPHRQVSLIDGMPEAGKSWVCMSIMVELARQKKHSLYICNEDAFDYTTEPRIMNVLKLEPEYRDYIHLFHNTVRHKMIMGRLHAEANLFTNAIRDTQAHHVFINPIQGFLPGRVKANTLEHISPLIDILSEIAQDEGCGISLIRHFAKKTGDGRKAVEMGHGSIGFAGSARTVLAVVPHPDYPEVSGVDFHKVTAVVQIKNNLGPRMPSVTFELRPDHFAWLPDAREVTPEELGDQATDPINSVNLSEVKDCYDLLKDMFKVRDKYEPAVIEAETKRIHYSMTSMRRAATQLGVIKTQERNDKGEILRHWWCRPKHFKFDAPTD